MWSVLSRRSWGGILARAPGSEAEAEHTIRDVKSRIDVDIAFKQLHSLLEEERTLSHYNILGWSSELQLGFSLVLAAAKTLQQGPQKQRPHCIGVQSLFTFVDAPRDNAT